MHLLLGPWFVTTSTARYTITVPLQARKQTQDSKQMEALFCQLTPCSAAVKMYLHQAQLLCITSFSRYSTRLVIMLQQTCPSRVHIGFTPICPPDT